MPALSAFTSRQSIEAGCCLIAGAAFVALASVDGADLAAAWLYPILLLRFARLTRPITGFVILSATLAVITYLTDGDMLPLPPVVLEISFLFGGLTFATTFLADRLIAPRLRGLPATLVFPAATTTFYFVLMFGVPFGTWGNAAYLQHDFPPLRQLASVTGLWGIVFLVAWAAAVINQVWESARLRDAAPAAATFGVAFGAALAFGGIQLGRPTADGPPVRVAALGNPPETRNVYAGCDNEPVCLAERTQQRYNAYFALTEEAARGGASIIIWPEAAAQYGASHEAEIFSRAAEVAQRYGVYLILGAARFPEGGPMSELVNKAVIFDREGAVVGEYHKAILVPGELGIPGDGAPMVFSTPYGRVGVFICFEADFLTPARRAVREGAELLLVPANDWQEIGRVHADMAAMRAVENGVPLVRAVSNGVSVAYDAAGRTLARNDAFTTSDFIMFADMTPSKRATIYPYIRDIVAWGSAILLVALAVLATLGAMRQRRSASSKPASRGN